MRLQLDLLELWRLLGEGDHELRLWRLGTTLGSSLRTRFPGARRALLEDWSWLDRVHLPRQVVLAVLDP